MNISVRNSILMPLFLILSFLCFAAHDTGIKKGIYSGSFDPPTKAHNAIIRSAIKNLALDKLYIFVNKNGSKNYKCSSKERVEMLQRMLSDLGDKVVIVAQESDNKRSDYLFIKKLLHEKLIHITGEDSYQRRLMILPENRVQFDEIAIVPRNSFHKNINENELEKNVFYLPLDEIYNEISSTETRRKLGVHDYKDIDLETEVLSYILEHGLYQEKSLEELDEKKQKFNDRFYSYIGRIYAPYQPPIFDPFASEEAWEERFYKWIYLEHQK